MKILELYAGSRSIGKVAEQLGYQEYYKKNIGYNLLIKENKNNENTKI